MPGPLTFLGGRGFDVLARAQDEALRLDRDYVGPEHLLLGLLREGGQASRVMRSFGTDLEKARNAVELATGRGSPRSPGADMTLSLESRTILETALQEAAQLGMKWVSPEHILLGIARAAGPVEAVFRTLGVSPAEVYTTATEEIRQTDSR